MPYLERSESEKRLEKVKAVLADKNLDLALVYYDEFKILNPDFGQVVLYCEHAVDDFRNAVFFVIGRYYD